MADMEKHEAFTKWALSQGVELNGVAAHRFPGRGLGIVATEAAKVCWILLHQFSHMILPSIFTIFISSYLLLLRNLMAILTSVLAKQGPDQSPNISSADPDNSQQIDILTSPWHNNAWLASSRSCN